MAKTFAFTFNINCLLDPSYSKNTNLVKNRLAGIEKQTQALKGKLAALDDELYNNTIDFEGYAEQLAKIKGKMENLQNSKINIKVDNLKDKTKSLIGFGYSVATLAQPLVGVINTSANFEAAMSKVGAISRATDSDMAILTKTARELGEKTQYSATQSAEAMSYLGMAGWNAQQIIGGMPGLLNLAAAGGTDLARTADIVSDNLTAFGLAAEQSGHMADVYATVITRTNTNVEMLGDTMKYAAPVAEAFGASMEETAALAGLMANSGIKASQAGTSLRAGFLRLAGPPKMAQKAMDQLGMSMNDITAEQKEAAMAMASLGISMSDTSGPKKMSAILTELRNKTSALGQEEKLAAMKAIFGQEAATGWLAVLNSGDGTFEKLVAELEDSTGAADKMAKQMQNNAKGAATRFQSAMESVAISVGSSLLPAIADITDKFAGFASVVSQTAGEHPALISAVVETGAVVIGLVGAVKAASVIYAAYQTAAAVATAAQGGLNAAILACPVSWLVAGIGVLIMAGYQLYKHWDDVSAALVGGWSWLKDTAIGVIDNIGNVILNLPEYAGYAIGYIISWFLTLPERFWGVITSLGEVGSAFVTNAGQWGHDAVESLITWFTNLPGRLSSIVVSAWESAKTGLIGGYNAGRRQGVAHNAKGGIYSKGAFLTTFAENEGESAIPHTPNARNIGLLAETNRIMGNPLGVGTKQSENVYLANGRDTKFSGTVIGLPGKSLPTSVFSPNEQIFKNFAVSNEPKSSTNIMGVSKFDLQTERNRIEANKNNGDTNITATFAPNITVQGGGDEGKIREVLELEMAKFKKMLQDLHNQQRRLSYA